MNKYPNYEILAKIATFSKDKQTISKVDIYTLLKNEFNINLTSNGYRTFSRQTYNFIRKTQSHKQATEFKLKIDLKLRY